MKYWYGCGIVKQGADGKATTDVALVIAPWYVEVTEWLWWNVITRICDLLHKVPLPKWWRNIKYDHWPMISDWMDFKRHKCDDWCHRDKKEGPSTWESYFGDDFSVFWHSTVERWTLNWHHNPKRRVEVTMHDVDFKQFEKFLRYYPMMHELQVFCKPCKGTGEFENDSRCIKCEGLGYTRMDSKTQPPNGLPNPFADEVIGK